MYAMLFFICISCSFSSYIFFINADLQVGNSYECFYIVVSHPREKLLRGPDVLTAMGSFPLPPCTDVHQVLIPRSHTRTSNTCTHCTTRHNHTQIQIDIIAPKHGHDYKECLECTSHCCWLIFGCIVRGLPGITNQPLHRPWINLFSNLFGNRIGVLP